MMKEYKYLYGSKLLKLNNPRDEDWVIFADISASELREAKSRGETSANRSIPHAKTLIQHFIKGHHVKSDPYKATYLYQSSNGFFSEDPEYVFKDFNILEHVDVWSLWLKAYINAESTRDLAYRSDKLPKSFYPVLYQYYMIKENTHWISDEAKKEVQKIHDLEVPAEDFEQLKELINSL